MKSIDRAYRHKHGKYLSEVNEQALVNLPLTFQGHHRSSDRFLWDIGGLSDYCTFDWADGDGLAPDVGPALTSSGTIVSGVETPFESFAGNDPTATSFGVGSYMSAATGEISSTEDIVIASLFCMKDINSGDDPYIHCMYSVSAGFGNNPMILFNMQNGILSLGVYGSSNIFPQLGGIGNGYCFCIAVIDIDGSSKFYCNKATSNALSTPSLLSKSDVLHFISVDVAGGRRINIARTMVFQGLGIADLVTSGFVARLTNSALGMASVTGPQCTFSRNSVCTKISGSKLFLFSNSAPCSGDSDGVIIEPQIENKVYNNYNPSVTTGLASTGGSLSVVDDSTQLAAASTDLSDLGPNAFEIANSSGSTQYVYSDKQLGNTNAHSLSVYARIVAGSGPKLGFYDQVGASFSSGLALSDGYARTEHNDQTPAASTDSLALEVPDGCTVRFVGFQAEELFVCTSFVPNHLTAATVTRPCTYLDTGVQVGDDIAGISFEMKTHVNANLPLSYWISSGDDKIFINAGTQYVASGDGANYTSIAVDVCDGNWHEVSLRWNSILSKFWLKVDSTESEATYDGGYPGVGSNITIGSVVAARGFPCVIRNVKVLRS